MNTHRSSFGQGSAMTSLALERSEPFHECDPSLTGHEAGLAGHRTNLVFAAKLLRCLRGGSMPPSSALEWSGFVEHWTVVARDDVCFLTGIVWRLPLKRHALATPLLAIDPVAGWARAMGEWLTIGAPRVDLATTGLHPEYVADRAERWLQRQLGANDEDGASLCGSN
jgi:hypothetical protein